MNSSFYPPYHSKKLIKWTTDFLFPKVCLACGNVLNKKEQFICQACLKNIPKTNFSSEKENPVAEIFLGLVNFEYASSMYYFHKDTRLQKLIHHLKYKNRPEVGISLGKEAGLEIKKNNWKTIDYIVPIPLHPLKQRKRGYNQSEKIAQGMSQTSKIKVNTEILVRNKNTETQTKKTKLERRENMKNVFTLEKPENFHNMHFILVDDVLTTGATMESAANTLLQIPGSKVSIFTIAFASQS